MAMRESPPSEWVRLVLVIPGSLWPIWEAVKDMLEREGIEHPVERVQGGMVLEILLAEFLAGQRTHSPGPTEPPASSE